VLAHHYPDVPNLGDMTKFKEWPDEPIDLLVGGTPCQSFSVAGLRKGLDDPRGNLMLTYLAIADVSPRWLVWENVPGVLSSNGGRDFGTFLGALGQLGYGFAYRVLDAQYFGVAQRRRRVFVVGYLGDWRRAAAVLFERESLSGHPAPSREAREEVAPTIAASSFAGGPNGEQAGAAVRRSVPAVAGSLDTQCGGGKLTHQSASNGHLILERDTIGTLTARGLNALGARDVEEGVLHPIAFGAQSNAVRRLTPTECERLQGFPDNYTQIAWRNKAAEDCPDGPRYKAMGNSMAVPVMRWIGERIQMVEEMT
jgi:DNA (cytosine-5)-methyltransferase 1